MSTQIWVLNDPSPNTQEFTIMRKFITLSLVATSALALAACSKSEAPADNATTELSADEATANAVTDEMTNVDAAAGADANATAANTVEAAGNAVEASNAGNAM
jgi:hypothetical protein